MYEGHHSRVRAPKLLPRTRSSEEKRIIFFFFFDWFTGTKYQASRSVSLVSAFFCCVDWKKIVLSMRNISRSKRPIHELKLLGVRVFDKAVTRFFFTKINRSASILQTLLIRVLLSYIQQSQVCQICVYSGLHAWSKLSVFIVSRSMIAAAW